MKNYAIPFSLCLMLVSCEKDPLWSKRKYCEQIGRNYERSLQKSYDKSASKNDSGNVNIIETNVTTWNCCESAKTCLADSRQISTVYFVGNAKTATDSRRVIDLMTNVSLLVKSVSKNELTRKEMEDFDAERDGKFPGCFLN